MNIEGQNVVSSLPDEILLMILDKVGFDSKHQLVDKQFQKVINSMEFDHLFYRFEKSPILRKVLEKVEVEHPNYSSNFEKVKEVYKTIIQLTSYINGGQEKIQKSLNNYGNLSLERLEELERWHQEQNAVNFIKVWEKIKMNPELDIEHQTELGELQENIKAKDLFGEVDEIHKWMNKYPELLNKIRFLNLVGLNLTAMPDELFDFKNLTIIKISDNKLTSIPHEIKNLTKLLVLDLHNNQLTTLPLEIGNFSKLKVLNISENPIKTLPKEILDSKNKHISQNRDVLAIKKASLREK